MRGVKQISKIFPSYGGASYSENSLKVIRLLRKGCNNRPFFHISVQESLKNPCDPVIEQIGSYDPFPNKYNEKVVGINFTRLEHWIRKDAIISAPVCILLGLAGYFPIHEKTFQSAWQNRLKISQLIDELKAQVEELQKKPEPQEATSEPSSEPSPSTSSPPESQS